MPFLENIEGFAEKILTAGTQMKKVFRGTLVLRMLPVGESRNGFSISCIVLFKNGTSIN